MLTHWLGLYCEPLVRPVGLPSVACLTLALNGSNPFPVPVSRKRDGYVTRHVRYVVRVETWLGDGASDARSTTENDNRRGPDA